MPAGESFVAAAASSFKLVSRAVLSGVAGSSAMVALPLALQYFTALVLALNVRLRRSSP